MTQSHNLKSQNTRDLGIKLEIHNFSEHQVMSTIIRVLYPTIFQSFNSLSTPTPMHLIF